MTRQARHVAASKGAQRRRCGGRQRTRDGGLGTRVSANASSRAPLRVATRSDPSLEVSVTRDDDMRAFHGIALGVGMGSVLWLVLMSMAALIW